MANSNEGRSKKPSAKSTQETSSATGKTTQPPKERKPAENTSSKHSTSLPLAVIIGVVALLCGLYAIYANFQSRQTARDQKQQFIAELKEVKQQQSDAQSTAAALQNLTHSQTRFTERLDALEKELQSAIQQRSYQRENWVLLKARYYLELAEINAHWSSDQQATIALLQQADRLLVNLSSQQLYAIRQAIAQEITELQALPKIDSAGLLSQLDAIQNNISGLPLKRPLSKEKKVNQVTAEKKTSSWREQLRDSLNSFEKLIVIRRTDEEIQPLLSPIHQTVLQDIIRMNLQEAQWAVLQTNPVVYQLALKQALQNIKRTFDENSSQTQALIKQLQTLQQEKLTVSIPVIGKSLSLLNQFIDSNQLNPGASAVKEGETSQ
ncbi:MULTISPECIES: uroporphyrinogen-III C-methyltransferase [unclassified Legionella]|uniref:uroporphyrinogen-III C-methyltransferase n=1 Tax=unclassified Legionella TaxID=2622702 RepID=UPI00105533A5|nr:MULTISPECIES: uroporphyrinogen-III C-methyltransferase [unclassified Legionella]MDI9819563.1 uroporphyrinogen-III C-methyltransferase [Legionella sp. PL877]